MPHNSPMTYSHNNPEATQKARRLEGQILALIKRGQMKEAIASCQQLNKQYPQFASGWYTCSQLAAKLGNAAMGLRAIENAIRLEPRENRWALQKAFCLAETGQLNPAREIALALDKKQLSSGYQCASLGLLLSRLGRQENALPHYQRAIRLEPELGEHYYNLATIHRFLGNFDAAEDALAQAIEKNPEDYEAYKLRSDLRWQTPERNHIESLQQAIARFGEKPRAAIQLHYSLAKELEDTGQWQRSFKHLRQGADTRRKLMRYDVQGDLDTLSKLAEVYDTALFKNKHPGDQNGQPIFILGMPRTGSTLLERIIGSHSEVYAAGELNNFAQEMMRAVQGLPAAINAGKPLPKTERVAQSAAIDFSTLGKAYIQSTRPTTESHGRFTDKMPVNFLYAGLIHLALPKAKIIHMKRHPLDACYAMYKNLFADAYPFSYNFEDLARYYAAYEKLMAHWHSMMPGVIYDIYYEDLVADIEGQSKQLFKHCELEWQAQCLKFYENQSASTTASASQIREPVYNSSVGKWRNFSSELEPLIKLLRDEGVEFAID
ncbi:MAG: sulfotransferase [Proteobacteria bacterium]|nr:sulfotransferase [Pseudomonadota bacterium]